MTRTALRPAVLIFLVIFLLLKFDSPLGAQVVPGWAPNTVYTVGSLVMFNNAEFRCLQAHTSMVGWEPPNVPALWQAVSGAPTPTPMPTPTATPIPTPSGPPATGRDQLNIVYSSITDDGKSFSGTLTVSNPNTSYTWNGSFFDIFNVACSTTATVTGVNTPNGPPQASNVHGGAVFNLTWQSMLGLGQTIPIAVTGTDGPGKAAFQNCIPNYVRGTTAIYPQYAGLPATWAKNKPNLSAADLIADPVGYYSAKLPAVTDKMIIYHPPHPTQVELNQVMSMTTPVNVVNGVRIWIPSKFMAMGVAAAYEFFKLNPNFLAGIGTKENFAAGLAPPSAGASTNLVTVNGITYSWPIVGDSPDGPFQQETGNFNDVRSFMPDFLPPSANHADYTTIHVTAANRDDPAWVSAAFSSALSLTVTRETLNAVPADNYLAFIQQMKDPWGELAMNAYAYNRGINSFFATHIFTAHRAQALTSADIATDFNLAGFGSYVATVRAITDAMNNDTGNTYDVMLTASDIAAFLTQLRKFYGNGVPSDGDFGSMEADVQRAFQVLARHWGGNTVSFRYDFLTLLRVAKPYLPQPYNPRPTGSNWYFLVTNEVP